MSNDNQIDVDVLVLGSGPGGYASAFRAADLGLSVALVERYPTLGGVCLNVGCIPSKALLHTAAVIDEVDHIKAHGVSFGDPKIDVNKVRDFKDGIVKRLTHGLAALAKQRKVQVVQGVGQFRDKNSMEVANNGNKQQINFKYAVIAAGSQPVKLPFIPEDKRIFDSTGALELAKTKGSLLVIGGGIIGLEMATVYCALGAKITVVELMDQIIPGADPDIVKPLHQHIKKRYENILLKTKVTKVEAKKDGIWVTFEGESAPDKPQKFDQVLVSVGRTPNGKLIGAENAGVTVDERGFVPANEQMQTNVPNIYAIGDIIGQPMLAHKATAEGRLAAEIIVEINERGSSKKKFDFRTIASVAFTDPEVAWTGLTELQAKEQGIDYGKGVFPWAASGRAIGIDRTEGMTKILFDNKTERVIGAGIVGPHAGDLITEIALAIEMDCCAEDIASTIHPHPTLSETVGLAAEAFEGTITDLYMPKKKKANGKGTGAAQESART